MDARRIPAAGQLLLFLFGAIGLGVSGLLLFEYLGGEAHICGPGGGCDAVRQSSYASLAGVPTPVFGVLYFAALVALAALGGRARALLPWLTAAGAAGGVAFLAIQALVLDAFCKFCVVVDLAAIFAFGAALLGGRGELLGRRPRALGSGAAAVVAALVALAGVHLSAPAAPPEEVEVVDELPAPVAAEQRDGIVTIVEFVDFQCPHCRRLHGELSRAIEPYGDRVRVVRKHVPLPGHPQAMPAAMAAVCAEQLGQGEAMADALFTAEELSPEAAARIAEETGLDMEAFRDCLGSSEVKERIESDLEDARESGVSGLPTFFVGHERFVGARPEDVLADSIERELARMKR